MIPFFFELLHPIPFPVDRPDKEAWPKIVSDRHAETGRWRIEGGALFSSPSKGHCEQVGAPEVDERGQRETVA
jgi:hypothetical protein